MAHMPALSSKFIFTTSLLVMAMVCASGAPVPKRANSALNEATSQDSASSIKWQSCANPNFSGWFEDYVQNVNTLQCATIRIALNKSNSAVAKANSSTAQTSTSPNLAEPATVIELALSKLPATGNRIGSVISISGGPGQSGLDVTAMDSDAYHRLSKHFDIIGFAPRGVYPSTPNIKCDLTHRTLHPTDPKAFAEGCWNHTPHDLLNQLGADYSVKDIDVIRQALGESQINVIGYSYGTKIAALYAEHYPDRLRAGVLDGVVNLNEDEVTMQLNQEASVQQTFERFVQQCRREPHCFFADSTTIPQAEAKIAHLFGYLDSHEVLDDDGERITPLHLSWTLYGFMAWPDRWPILNEVLWQLEAKDFSALKMMIDEDKGSIDFATFTAIDCAERAPNASKRANYLQDSIRINAQSTWDNHRPPKASELLDTCYYWPVAGSDTPHIPKLAASAPTLLLVAQTNDAATPYANALAMQHYLNAVLLTREGDGHTLVLADDSRCVDNKVVDYLIDPQSFKKLAGLPPQDKRALICRD
ncbi:MAG: alpha/beta hydrolase [Psychrobacter sp.]|nr:alpha/beta hydrolase [Psychrobacter sp.]